MNHYFLMRDMLFMNCQKHFLIKLLRMNYNYSSQRKRHYFLSGGNFKLLIMHYAIELCNQSITEIGLADV